MSEELTIFEQLGGSYIEINGLLYPVIDKPTMKSENVWGGKVWAYVDRLYEGELS